VVSIRGSDDRAATPLAIGTNLIEESGFFGEGQTAALRETRFKIGEVGILLGGGKRPQANAVEIVGDE
jgi:hypothetical protein